MKKLIFTLFIAGFTLITACKDEEVPPNVITALDFAASIDENPADGAVLGQFTANTSRGAIQYSISSQSVSNAIAIDASSGIITVEDASAFNYETNTSITGKIKITNEDAVEKEVNFTITINDVVAELKSIDFDGTDDSFTISQIDGYGTNPLSLTVSAWVKTSASGKFMQIVTSHESTKFYNLSISDDGFPRFAVRIVAFSGAASVIQVQSADVIADNNWHHIVGVWNGTTGTRTLKIYVDGVEKDSETITSGATLNWFNQRTTIGSWKENSEFFEGKISAVSVWNRPFSATEIAGMNQCYGGTESNLVAYWNFDLPSTNSLEDASNNNNDMSFVGGAPSLSTDIPFNCE